MTPASPTAGCPLSRLFEQGRAAASLVSFGRVERSFADLARDVGRLASRVARTGSGRWILYSEDAYAFAVGLLALAQTRCVALLPPNRQPGTLRGLAAQAVGALLDPDAHEGLGRLPVIAPLEPGPLEPCAPGALDRDAPLLELFTSGTTGAGKSIPKALRHLEDEVAVLESAFGEVMGAGTPVFATVSHQHLYGLLFRVLWPLAAGRPFRSEAFLHYEELVPRLGEVGRFALVSTPVHLKRLPAPAEVAALAGRCRAVFSSGGPLEPATASAVAWALGRAPIEIYGSTETGGVATRQSALGQEAWRPLPGVRVARDDEESRLVVVSPFVSAGDQDAATGLARQRTGDRCELLADGRFRLLGRADRVVKVGEKRASLPEMESALLAHPFVAEVALTPFEQGAETRIGAVVVPTEAGARALAERGRRAAAASLVEALRPYWDRVLLPRAFRWVDEIPRDAQGKLQSAALRELVEGAAAGDDVGPRRPLEESRLRSGRSLSLRLRVPPDLVFLAGHFEGFPVVAGVVQLGWAVEAASDLLGEPVRVRRVEALKFPNLLRPGQGFGLEVEAGAAADRVTFRLADGATVFASGRLVLSRSGAP
jgi:acyl-coenzyme A synthetase/AMP-(fatty) acid ligase/3-hydroxymyristoyl/3-hydroxydecanoyl-(acyl carrier protein) dehydratase